MNYQIFIQFKIIDQNDQYKSISYLQSVTFNEIDKLSDIFIEYWLIRSEEYPVRAINSIVFTFKIMTKSLVPELKSKLLRHKSTKDVTPFTFKGINLPTKMDYLSWGTVLSDTANKAIIKKNLFLRRNIILL